MGIFSVQLARSAGEDLRAIPKKFQKQVLSDLISLADKPLPQAPRVKKLKGFKPPLYRLRSGDYRVLYRFESATVTILRIIDRKELERIVRGWNL